VTAYNRREREMHDITDDFRIRKDGAAVLHNILYILILGIAARTLLTTLSTRLESHLYPII